MPMPPKKQRGAVSDATSVARRGGMLRRAMKSAGYDDGAGSAVRSAIGRGITNAVLPPAMRGASPQRAMLSMRRSDKADNYEADTGQPGLKNRMAAALRSSRGIRRTK